jgi:hypothetical protein
VQVATHGRVSGCAVFKTHLMLCVAARIRDWQYPQDSSALRSEDGQTIITDHGLREASQLLLPYSHFVCSWTGAQMLSRVGSQHTDSSCYSHDAAAHGLDGAHACAHLQSWSPVNHYPLLALLAARLPLSSLVIEIGTIHGAAAFALRAGLDEGCRQKVSVAASECAAAVVLNIVSGILRHRLPVSCSHLQCCRRCCTQCQGLRSGEGGVDAGCAWCGVCAGRLVAHRWRRRR